MAEDDEDDDWTTALPFGDTGVRTSARRQVGVIVGIVVVTIAVLAGLVVAGAAVLHVVTDRTTHSRSYSFGHDLAEKARDVVTPLNGNADQDWDRTCRELINTMGDQLGPRPQPFHFEDAVSGCTETLNS